MNAPLPASAGPSTEPRGIDKLFGQMAGVYGSKFADLWAGVDPEQVKKVWIAGLTGLTGQEIARGIDACIERGNAFPPTLPEFRNLCRPALDMQSLLHLAIREMSNRSNRQPEQWPDNRTFWAAQRIGRHDMLSLPADKLQKRFELAWLDAYADRDKAIPAATDLSVLPAPGRTTIGRDEATKRTEDMAKRAGGVKSPEQICRSIAQEIASSPDSEKASTVSWAIGALKFWRMPVPPKLVARAIELGLVKPEQAEFV